MITKNYSPSYSFRGFQTLNPTLPLPGDKVDIEFQSAGLAIDANLNALAQVRRDDGQLTNGIVGTLSLGADTLALLAYAGGTPKGAWTTSTVYVQKDIVTQSGNTYICVTGHTAGTFATDLAANKWMLFCTPAVTYPVLAYNTFTGNGSTTAYTLSADPGSINNTWVFLNGVLQAHSTYSVAGTTLTFNTAPGSGVAIVVKVASTLAAGSPSDGSVTLAKMATGALDSFPVLADGTTTRRNLGTRFAETRNVKDWGATGDGSTDDSAAFTAALAACSTGDTLIVPKGTYKLNASFTIPADVRFLGVNATLTDIRTSGVLLVPSSGSTIEGFTINGTWTSVNNNSVIAIQGNMSSGTNAQILYNTISGYKQTIDVWGLNVRIAYNTVQNCYLGIQNRSGFTSEQFVVEQNNGYNCGYTVTNTPTSIGGGGTAFSLTFAGIGLVEVGAIAVQPASGAKGYIHTIAGNVASGDGGTGTFVVGQPVTFYIGAGVRINGTMGSCAVRHNHMDICANAYQFLAPGNTNVISFQGNRALNSTGSHQFASGSSIITSDSFYSTGTPALTTTIDSGLRGSGIANYNYPVTLRGFNTGWGVFLKDAPIRLAPAATYAQATTEILASFATNNLKDDTYTNGWLLRVNTTAGGTAPMFLELGYTDKFDVTQGEGTIKPWTNSILKISSSAVLSGRDGVINLGGASDRFGTVYATTGAINTSDKNRKTELLPFDDVLLDIYGELRFGKYKLLDSVAEKGFENSRWHFGAIAQDFQELCLAKGIDPSTLALWCRDDVIEAGTKLETKVNPVTGVYETIEEYDPVKVGEVQAFRYDYFTALEVMWNRREHKRAKDEVSFLHDTLADTVDQVKRLAEIVRELNRKVGDER